MNVTQHRLPMGVGRGDCGPPPAGMSVMDVTQYHLPMGVGRGDYDQPSAGTALNGQEWSQVKGTGSPMPSKGYPRRYWCRLGCKVPTYESGVRGREPPDEEITEQVISRGKG